MRVLAGLLDYLVSAFVLWTSGVDNLAMGGRKNKIFFRCLLVRPILVPVAAREKQFGKLTKIVAIFPMMILEYFFEFHVREFIHNAFCNTTNQVELKVDKYLSKWCRWGDFSSLILQRFSMH